MPCICVLAAPLSHREKSELARAFSRIVKNAMPVPAVEVFFPELPAVFVDGEESRGTFATLIMDGPDIPPEKTAALCAELHRAFKEHGPESNESVTLVYHANDPGHIGINGVLLANRKGKL